jgi:hypothetical protein
MFANFISAIVTIAAGIIGFASGAVTIIDFIEKHRGLTHSLKSLHLPHFTFTKYSALKIPALLIICFALIVTGIISASNVLSPAYVKSQHQNAFNQTIESPPTYSYSMQEADEHWTVGQPQTLGTSGSCNFQNQLYIVTMTLKNHYYPCYNMESNFQNFLFQVQIQVQQGDSGGIIFRDQPKRPDAYYLYLSETGTYVLGYWPNANIGGTIELFSGTNIDFLRDQVQGRFSTIAIRALGDDLSFYINGMYIAHAQNSILSSGRIGLVAQKTLNDTTVAYRHVQIWRL